MNTLQEMSDAMEKTIKKYMEETEKEEQIKGLVTARDKLVKELDDELNKLDPDKSIRKRLNLL